LIFLTHSFLGSADKHRFPDDGKSLPLVCAKPLYRINAT
jgi:hypothetical protein